MTIETDLVITSTHLEAIRMKLMTVYANLKRIYKHPRPSNNCQMASDIRLKPFYRRREPSAGKTMIYFSITIRVPVM